MAQAVVRGFPGENRNTANKAQESGRGGMDLTFLVLVLLLLAFGLVMLFSASYAYAFYYYNNSFEFISKQIVFAAAGVVAMILISFVDYRILRRFAYIMAGGSILLLVAVLFSAPINNARRWIDLGFTQFQPSELMKFALIVLFAHMICKNYNKMKTFRYGMLPFGAVLGVISVLMILEPHLSGTILMLAIGLTMIFVGGADYRYFAIAGILGIAAIALVILAPDLVPYGGSRIEHWLDPFKDYSGDGFQTIQSLYAISSGGLFGVGIGNSRQKYLYLPEVQNDFVFSIVCEELGFIGACIIIVLFALFVWRGFVIAFRARDRFGTMLAVGLTTQVGIQAILNIAVVTNTVPNTGISLPFFSYGGTALMMLLCQMGVILSISRDTALEKQ